MMYLLLLFSVFFSLFSLQSKEKNLTTANLKMCGHSRVIQIQKNTELLEYLSELNVNFSTLLDHFLKVIGVFLL